MLYKDYGKTGAKVSALGFGGMRFSDEDISAGRLEACADVVLHAYKKGVNYFDTAPNYCQDKSEEIMGLAFSQMERSKFYCTSKNSMHNTGDSTPDDFRRRLETSLKRMRVDKIDFYHIWCMLDYRLFERHIAPGGMYDTLLKAKEEGLIGEIVFSAHASGEEIQRMVQTGKFAGMLIGYNATNYAYRQLGIKAAYDAGMGVVVMNPLGGGVIPQNPEKYAYLCTTPGFDVAQSALRFVAGHREISVTLCGLTTTAQVDDAVAAMENLTERSADEMVKLYEEGFRANDLCTGCKYCDECPKGIAVPKFMDMYNTLLLGGDARSVINRGRYHWGIDVDQPASCIGCGVCEGLCTQHLPIIERMAQIADMPK